MNAPTIAFSFSLTFSFSLIFALVSCAGTEKQTMTNQTPTCDEGSWVIGKVSNANKPTSGATIAAIKAWDTQATALAMSSPEGSFRLCLPKGEFALTATANGATAAYLAPTSQTEMLRSQPILTLGGPAGALEVSVSGVRGKSYLRAIRRGDSIGDIFFVPLQGAGERILLPLGSLYQIDVVGDSRSLAKPADLSSTRPFKTSLEAYGTETIRAPPNENVLKGLRDRAIEISTTDPTATETSDLHRIGETLKDKDVIGFGENSHGIHEFFEFRHRFLAYAAKNLGYTVFALESGFARGQAINEYVLGGKGDPAKLLSEIGYWPWDIYELERTLRWMRTYNLDVPEKRKLKFYGVDMQYANVAFRLVKDFGDAHSQQVASEANKVAVLEDDEFTDFLKLSNKEQAALCDSTDKIVQLFETHKESLSTRVGERAWGLARQNAVVLDQSCRSITVEADSPSYRDESMAKNLEWILLHEGQGTKVMVWAHNGHVSKSSQGFEPMGSFLGKSLGSRYASIGQFFHHGELRAWDTREQDPEKLSVLPIKVGPPPAGSIGDALSRLGFDRLFLSLSSDLSSLTIDWLRRPHLYRQVSALYSGEGQASLLISLPASFDAVVFLRTVSATEAKPTGLRGPKSR